MSILTNTALRGAAGLIVLAALFITIWAARDSSARVGPVRPEQVFEPAPLDSARTHRGNVTRTAIPPERLERLERSAKHP